MHKFWFVIILPNKIPTHLNLIIIQIENVFKFIAAMNINR